MILEEGSSPDVIQTVLDLANSVQPHKFSVVGLYKEATHTSLELCSKSSPPDASILESVMEKVSEHETDG